MTSILNILSIETPQNNIKKLSVVAFLFLVLSLFLFCIVNNILLYILIATGGIYFAYLFFGDVRLRFAATLGIIFLLQLYESKVILAFIAAAVYGGGFIIILVKRKFMERQTLTNSALFIPFAISLLWSACIGLIGVGNGEIEFEYWIRELLLWSPLFLLPIYYSEIVEKDLHPEQFLSRCLIFWWGAVFIAEVVKVKESFTQSLFLFQVGVRRLDPVSGVFMMFVFLSLAMIISDRRRLLLLGGFFLSVISMLLSFARTSWVAVVPLIPFVIFFGNRVERKQGLKFILMLIIFGVFFLIFGYFYIHVIQIGILFIGSKFLSVVHPKTDASLYGRYVEWRYVMQAIINSPLAGYGLGSRFEMYNWFGGFMMKSGYSHSTYLSILYKSGIIGTILLFIPFIGYFLRGIQYMRNSILTQKERAYMRVGVVLMIFMMITGYTGNIFFQRELMLYVAFYWCYCMQIEYKLKKHP